MKIKLSPAQLQKTILSPSMQQSIEVLLLPIAELNTAIDQEIQENPLLEIDEAKTAEKQQLENLVNDNITRLSQADSTGPYYDYSNVDTEDDSGGNERQISRPESLEDFLLQQLRLELTDPIQLRIGELIISQLNEDGFLTGSLDDIAHSAQVSIEIVEPILHIIQQFEPSGIAARDLKECLLLQIPFRFNGHQELIRQIIENHLDDLGRRKHTVIARKMKIPLEDVKSLAQLIGLLEPKPARNFQPLQSNMYVKPDIHVTQNTDDPEKLHIRINQDNIPSLRISAFYQNLLRKPNRTPEEMEFIREKIKRALLFIRSIEQRHETIRRIAEYITSYQKDFFLQGPTAIKPMTLKDVATSIERNESTVCRAISQKHINTPYGLLPIKYFFSQGIASEGNDTVSSRSIKEELKNLIDNEDKNKPLSDQAIQNYFVERKKPVARRTITKYRKVLHILPSHLRKK